MTIMFFKGDCGKELPNNNGRLDFFGRCNCPTSLHFEYWLGISSRSCTKVKFHFRISRLYTQGLAELPMSCAVLVQQKGQSTEDSATSCITAIHYC